MESTSASTLSTLSYSKIITGIAAAGTVSLVASAIGLSIANSEYTVNRVIDGDTIVVSRFGSETTVRLLNINTPETKDPEKPVQCLGPEATQFLKELLPPGTEVSLKYDLESVDKYGRTLAAVFKDNVFVNAEIAAAGLGVPILIQPNSKFFSEVEAASKSARGLKRGLFSEDSECTIPSHFTAVAKLQIAATQTMSAVEADNQRILEEYQKNAISVIKKIQDMAYKAYSVNEVFRSEGYKHTDEATPFKNLEKELEKEYKSQLETMRDEGERLVAEKKEQEEKAAKEAAERAEKERLQREERQRAELQHQQALSQQNWQQPAPQEQNWQQPAPIPSQPTPAPQVVGGCFPHGVAPPGYNGKRCYRPGGKTWCVC